MCRPPSDIIEVSLVHDPVVMAIVENSTRLSEMMKSWDETRQEGVKGHPKDCVPPNVRETIINWLGSKRQVRDLSSYTYTPYSVQGREVTR